jgi:hypothetical protein
VLSSNSRLVSHSYEREIGARAASRILDESNIGSGAASPSPSRCSCTHQHVRMMPSLIDDPRDVNSGTTPHRQRVSCHIAGEDSICGLRWLRCRGPDPRVLAIGTGPDPDRPARTGWPLADAYGNVPEPDASDPRSVEDGGQHRRATHGRATAAGWPWTRWRRRDEPLEEASGWWQNEQRGIPRIRYAVITKALLLAAAPSANSALLRLEPADGHSAATSSA